MKSARDEGWLIDGVIHLDHKGRFGAELKRMGARTRIQVHVFTGITIAARGYYRAGVLKPLSEKTGYTPSEWHEMLKRRFNPISRTVVNEQTGEEGQFVYGGSFEDMGAYEFGQILDEIIEWGRTVVGADIRPPTKAERLEMGIGQEDSDGGLHGSGGRRREARGG